jgi:hypothetical protein
VENDKYYGLREVLPKFRSTSVVVLSSSKRGVSRRRSRRRFDAVRRSLRWQKLYLEV